VSKLRGPLENCDMANRLKNTAESIRGISRLGFVSI